MREDLLTERVYKELRLAIVEGRMGPNQHLSQRELSAQLVVSRTPVREALRRLELEGYVQRTGAGRLLVHALSTQEVTNLFFVRELLEGYSAWLAAFRISDAELRALERLGREDEQALRRRSLEDLVVINEQIHATILGASRNRTLQQLLRDLDARIYGMTMFAVGLVEDQRAFVDEHLELIRHLRHGDPNAAQELVRRHVRRGLDLLLAGLAESSTATPAAELTAALPG